MAAPSLHRTLTRQWVGFTFAVTFLLLIMGAVGLYSLEDHFFNRRLRDTARSITHLAPPPRLPSGFSAFLPRELPDALGSRLRHRRPGAIVEFWTPEGRYIHALWSQTPSGEAYALVHDVTDELTVNAGLRRYGVFMVATLAAFLGGAWVLARTFAQRLRRQFESLVAHLQQSETPEALAAYAERTSVAEFQWMALHSATAWKGKLEALAQERETLAYLAHELASPLQSARAAMDTLEAPTAEVPAWGRLRRAIARLERVNRSIRWLESGTESRTEATAALRPLVEALVLEFQPMAQRRNRDLRLEVVGDGPWAVPQEVLETLVANLLLNALQHGVGTEVYLRLTPTEIRVQNAVDPNLASSSSRLGLRIVGRWVERFALRLETEQRNGLFEARVWAPPGPTCSADTARPLGRGRR